MQTIEWVGSRLTVRGRKPKENGGMKIILDIFCVPPEHGID